MSQPYNISTAVVTSSALKASALFEKVREDYNRRARLHLQSQIETVVAGIETQLNALHEIGGEDSILLNEYLVKVSEVTVKLRELSRELGQPFLLFVVGAGKAGKSTLINALLGKKAAEMGKVPKTWKVDVYFGSEERKMAEIRYRNGASCFRPIQEVKQEIETEEEKRKQSEKIVAEELTIIKSKTNNDPEILEEKKRELQKHHLYRSPIVEVRWPFEEAGFLQKFRLVDTPGLKQEGFFENIEETAIEYYAKADGVIWLLSADVMADKGPREEIEKILARFGNRTGNIIAIVNQMDKVRNNGGEIAVERVMKDAKEKFGDLFSEMIPFSAQEALNGIMTQNQQLIESSGMNALFAAIERRFVTQAQYVQVHSKTTGVAGIVSDFFSMTESFIAKLEVAEKDRNKRMQNWLSDKDSFQKQIRKSMENCLAIQIEKVKRNAQTHENALWDLPADKRQAFVNEKICENASFESVLESLRKKSFVGLESLTQVHKKASAFAEFPLLAAKGFLTKPAQRTGNISYINVAGNTFESEDAELMVGGGAALAACAIAGPIGLLAFFVIGTDIGKFLVQAVARIFGNLPEKITAKYQVHLTQVKQALEKEETEWMIAAEKEVSEMRERTFSRVFAPSEKLDEILKRMHKIGFIVNKKISPLTAKDILLKK